MQHRRASQLDCLPYLLFAKLCTTLLYALLAVRPAAFGGSSFRLRDLPATTITLLFVHSRTVELT